MDKTCETCKHHKEQDYTGIVKPNNVQCLHPNRKAEWEFPLRHSYCDMWEDK
jgi:hypothetical protein